jgi:hydrogenase expression/formation protein HypE
MNNGLSCPAQAPSGDRLLLAHGEGARLTRALIREVVLKHFNNEFLRPLGDAALLPATGGRILMTTDGYVVSPLEFPGGDIGSLAVHGTINDLAVSGGDPIALTVGMILEEGLDWGQFERIIVSIADAARRSGVPVVAGDTKVVPRGTADKVFITMSGVGRLREGVDLGPHRVRSGDRILISGTIGDHGMAVLAAREGFELGDHLRSDTAPIHNLMTNLFSAGVDVHFARDPTRGGVSAVLHELVDATGLAAILDEPRLPVSDAVRGACEHLGLDPLFVANEGKVVLIVPQHHSAQALELLRSHSLGRSAQVIGEMADSQRGVLVRGLLGVLRPLDEPSGALLPRIC